MKLTNDSTMQQLLEYINNHLYNINKSDVMEADSLENYLRELFIKKDFDYSSIFLLKGKRNIKIFNMEFKLKIIRNKLGIKHYHWSEKWELCNTVVEVINDNNYDLNITLKQMYEDLGKTKQLKLKEDKKEHEKTILKIDEKIKKLNIDIRKLSNKQLKELIDVLKK